MSDSKYTVILLSDDKKKSNKGNIINAVVKLLRVPKSEAKSLVNIAPSVLGENVPENTAVALIREIEKNNGRVKLLTKTNNAYYDAQINASDSYKRSVSNAQMSSNNAFQNYKSFNEGGSTYKSSGVGQVPAYKSVGGNGMPISSGANDNPPVFRAPSDSDSSGAPVFRAPSDSDSLGAPVFRAPSDSGSSGAPVFRAPSDSGSSGAPVFRAPSDSGSSGAPVFNAPSDSGSSGAPVFSSPNTVHNGECCSYHPHNRAVARCDNCGKPICQECRDAGVREDGSHWCFDCTSAMVQNDIELAKEQRSGYMGLIIIGVVGAIIIAILSFTEFGINFLYKTFDGESVNTMRILFIMFGASLAVYLPILWILLTYIWKFIRWKPISYGGIIGTIFLVIKIILVIVFIEAFFMVFGFFLMISPIVAIILGIIYFVKYKKANDLVLRNQEILQHLSDRMEYIRIQSEENIDYNTLASDARMQNNHFAQAVMREGYESANRTAANEAREMVENDKNIKKAFKRNEFGEVVRAA